ncbi:sigma-70 family RNA polymerase sigma factor [Candidatus Solirubrobacter pratensis]|uniref:sigma-70 family RNA polymerase sigma factor n=1 Tax=Candidatus Solirubrobacter pratensis TaxID=1298857 RepID=UPI0004064504|nr:sigma-70 family RNA polymerase sigma factor [Candidatus Solirubrobacter pratensis]
MLAPVVHDADGDSPADSDQRLVAAVRAGDDRAFEALYERYQRRIHAYALGMVKDHGRAEDVTQEVFVSALRRMRATERPIAFKPWVYEIAKNACIDAFRRSRRAEEVSYDAEEGLAPGDHSRLASNGPSPEAAVAAKHDLQTLCGAFGGLSESHHQILVLRELEGLTYDQIGARMGMTRPAVESTLFRARRRLTEEYDELVSGARCQRVQSIIAAAASGALGVRDSRRLSRHLSHCQSCRREALAAGLDRGLLVRRPALERAAEKVAGLLPFPAFLRLRRGAGSAPSASEPTGARLAAHLPALSDQLSGPWAKAVTGAALLVTGVGTGMGVHEVASRPDRAAARPAAVAPVSHKPPGSHAATTADSRATVTVREASSRSGGDRGKDSRRSAHRSHDSGSAPDRATSVGGGAPAGSAPPPAPAPASAAPAGRASDSTSGASKNAASPTPAVKTPSVPASTPDAVKQAADGVQQTSGAVAKTVDQTADTVDKTVQSTTGALTDASKDATGALDGAVVGATGGGPVPATVKGATDTVGGAVDGVKKTVDGATGAVTDTLKQGARGLLGGH